MIGTERDTLPHWESRVNLLDMVNCSRLHFLRLQIVEVWVQLMHVIIAKREVCMWYGSWSCTTRHV